MGNVARKHPKHITITHLDIEYTFTKRKHPVSRVIAYNTHIKDKNHETNDGIAVVDTGWLFVNGEFKGKMSSFEESMISGIEMVLSIQGERGNA